VYYSYTQCGILLFCFINLVLICLVWLGGYDYSTHQHGFLLVLLYFEEKVERAAAAACVTWAMTSPAWIMHVVRIARLSSCRPTSRLAGPAQTLSAVFVRLDFGLYAYPGAVYPLLSVSVLPATAAAGQAAAAHYCRYIVQSAMARPSSWAIVRRRNQRRR